MKFLKRVRQRHVTKWEKLFNQCPHLYDNTSYFIKSCADCQWPWLSSNPEMEPTPLHCRDDLTKCAGVGKLSVLDKAFIAKVYFDDRQMGKPPTSKTCTEAHSPTAA